MSKLRICCLYPRSNDPSTPWNLTLGIVKALRRMGHTVTVPPCSESQFDLVLCLGLEHYWREAAEFLASVRGVKVAWYYESMEREDVCWDFPGDLQPLADNHFFSAAEDARKYPGSFLEYGVDTEIFRPYDVPKSLDAAFIGSLYEKRRLFLEQVRTPIHVIQPNRDSLSEAQVEILARAYCGCRVVVHLPMLSHVIGTRVYEAMACKVPLIAPAESSLPIGVVYNSASELDAKLHDMLSDPDRYTETVSACYDYVTSRYSLPVVLGRLLECA